MGFFKNFNLNERVEPENPIPQLILKTHILRQEIEFPEYSNLSFVNQLGISYFVSYLKPNIDMKEQSKEMLTK
jgi:hypothetical protein